MPIQKNITSKTGHDGNYWVVGRITLELYRNGNYIEAELLQFKSEADYLNGASAMGGRVIRFEGDENPVNTTNAAQLMFDFYSKVIEQYPEFENGVVVG